MIARLLCRLGWHRGDMTYDFGRRLVITACKCGTQIRRWP